MNKPNRWTFVVTGGGQFPLDMLRYDCCWPATQSSIVDMVVYPGDSFRNERVVRLNGTQAPDVERWKSFMWRVTEISSYRVG